MTQILNEIFILPHDIQITFTDCGEANAFYDSESQQIIVCYDLISYLSQILREFYKSDEELGEAVLGATFFIFLHELGHTLIDVYDLPITGREEDVADQLATYILAESGEDGQAFILHGATSFLLLAQDEDAENLPFWDEHALGQLRFYNVMCWVYGKNREDNADLLGEDGLPEERAKLCQEEYEKMSESFERLLGSYIKE